MEVPDVEEHKGEHAGAAEDELRAAEEGNLDGVQLVREKPELLEVQDELGNSALHLAATFLQADVIKELLSSGAPPDVVDADGNTPLLALLSAANADDKLAPGLLPSVEALAGAADAMSQRDAQGRTAADLARASPHEPEK